jgi:NAD(P)-dependent dehydrogenase (short-subunit alcohol dehydrogenase family)
MRLEGKRFLITGTGGGQRKAAQALFAQERARHRISDSGRA